MTDVLIQFLENFRRKLDVSELLDFVINTEVKELIIELNQSQLYDLGEDSEGRRLFSFSPDQPYSPYTVVLKEAKGQPTDRLTLNDSGAFYKSFTVQFNGKDIILDANGQKDDTDLFSEYGDDILGLNSQSMRIFIDRLQTEAIFYIQSK